MNSTAVLCRVVQSKCILAKSISRGIVEDRKRHDCCSRAYDNAVRCSNVSKRNGIRPSQISAVRIVKKSYDVSSGKFIGDVSIQLIPRLNLYSMRSVRFAHYNESWTRAVTVICYPATAIQDTVCSGEKRIGSD